MAALALTPTLLPFQRRALDELVAGDGLAVFSAGLGWHGVVAALLHLQARRRWGLAGGVGGVGHGREGRGGCGGGRRMPIARAHRAATPPAARRPPTSERSLPLTLHLSTPPHPHPLTHPPPRCSAGGHPASAARPSWSAQPTGSATWCCNTWAWPAGSGAEVGGARPTPRRRPTRRPFRTGTGTHCHSTLEAGGS